MPRKRSNNLSVFETLCIMAGLPYEGILRCAQDPAAAAEQEAINRLRGSKNFITNAQASCQDIVLLRHALDTYAGRPGGHPRDWYGKNQGGRQRRYVCYICEQIIDTESACDRPTKHATEAIKAHRAVHVAELIGIGTPCSDKEDGHATQTTQHSNRPLEAQCAST